MVTNETHTTSQFLPLGKKKSFHFKETLELLAYNYCLCATLLGICCWRQRPLSGARGIELFWLLVYFPVEFNP